MRTAATLIFDKCLYLRGRLRLTTARRLSAYMSTRALATTTASSWTYFLFETRISPQSVWGGSECVNSIQYKYKYNERFVRRRSTNRRGAPYNNNNKSVRTIKQNSFKSVLEYVSISGANWCIVFHSNYGSILLSFRAMTTGRTTGLEASHSWSLSRPRNRSSRPIESIVRLWSRASRLSTLMKWTKSVR